MDVQLEHSEVVLTNVHDANSCIGPHCSLHNRSDHSMRSLPQNWRPDRYLMERICEHGVGHPDPDDPKISMHPGGKPNYELVHGCCENHCCDGAYN